MPILDFNQGLCVWFTGLDDATVKRAFQTLLVYVGNVAKNPDREKFRRIRIGNPLFQVRHLPD
jgi:hypothetical protein